MKKVYINLKDWLNLYENIDYAQQIEGLDVTVFPSLPYLYIYKDRNVKLGSQKISSYDEGPHTGSISGNHLKDFGVGMVILNHRECQIDDIEKLISKIKNAKEWDIEVIICISSSDEEELEKIEKVLEQTGSGGIHIAFEPTFSLELDEIKLNLEKIRGSLSHYELSYIYGNNVTTSNCSLYDKELPVDGFLISSHALTIKNLKEILSTLKD